MTLACEDDNSKLVQVVTVIEVDDKKRVGNIVVKIWKVNFGFKVMFGYVWFKVMFGFKVMFLFGL